VWRFLKKLEIELPYDPAIPLLGIHTEKTRRERDTCTPMFIAALFIIARTRKQPRCPSADEWIRKLWELLVYFWDELFVGCFICYYFLPSEGCLFTLLIVSFDVQKLLRLIRSHLFIFAFVSNILGGGS